ncbi:mitochondrial import inner membrane translocase subunit tim16-like [Branchiostoma lanceolatum]|uniref:mitochondrial import inner membrane translocase subunit tim16-like n=1 Tax=Branchiostoma lanceolatum TaxID=7740 RepID=UPI003451F3AF
MAKYLAQAIVLGAQVVGRAFSKALRQEFQNAQQAQRAAGGGRQGAKRAASDSMMGISVQEAKQILDVDKLDKELIEKNYTHLFDVNDKKKGGSFYLQSKVYRAKERLDEELREADVKSTKEKQKEDSAS